MEVFFTALNDQLASSLFNCPPAYIITPAPPPSLRPPQAKQGANKSSPAAGAPPVRTITVYQHRPCYAIQMYLRATSTTHVLSNSPHSRLYGGRAAMPLLVDETATATYVVPSPITGGGGGDCYVSHNPSLATPAPPPPPAPPLPPAPPPLPPSSTTDPLSHLTSSHTNLDAADPSIKAELLLYSTLLSSTLSANTLALTYADPAGFKQLSNLLLPPPAASFFSLSRFVSSFSLWAEKVSVLRSLPPSLTPIRRNTSLGFFSAGGAVQLDTTKALLKCRDCYDAFDEKLTSSGSTTSTRVYILNTVTPTTLDCLLFQHIIDALANPHLVKILPHYTNIMRYFVTLCELFFVKPKGSSGATDPNDAVNAENQFDILPACYAFAVQILSSDPDKPAVDYEAIAASIAASRASQLKSNLSLNNLNRLRYQASILPDKASATTKETAKAPQSEFNDNTLWFAGVAVLSAGFLVASNKLKIKG